MVSKTDNGRNLFSGQTQNFNGISQVVADALNVNGSLPYRIGYAVESIRRDFQSGEINYRFSEILDEFELQARDLGDDREDLREFLKCQLVDRNFIDIEQDLKKSDPEVALGNRIKSLGQSIQDRTGFYSRGHVHVEIDKWFDDARTGDDVVGTFTTSGSADELPDGEEPKFAIDGLCYDKTFSIWGGDPKSLKTTLCMDLALGVLTGNPVLGCYEVRKTGPAVFIQADEGESYFGYRMRQLAKAREIGKFKHPFHFVCTADIDLSDVETRTRLAEEIEALEPALVIIDPLRDVFSGNENSSEEVKPVLDFCIGIRNSTGAIVVLIDHLVKPSGRATGPAAAQGYQLRGTGAKYGRADSILTIQALNNGECSVVNAIHRYGPPPDPIYFKFCDERAHGRGIFLDITDPPENVQSNGRDRQENRIREFLNEKAFAWYTTRAIREAARTSHKRAMEILEKMLECDQVELREGKQNSKEWRFVAPTGTVSQYLSQSDDKVPF